MPTAVNSKSAALDNVILFNAVKGSLINQLASSPYPSSTTGDTRVDKNIALFMQNGYYTKVLTNMVLTQIIATENIAIDSESDAINGAISARWLTVFAIQL
jgi:hypothetical protein